MKFYKKLNKFKIYFLTIFINKLTIYPNINYFLKYIYKTKKIFFLYTGMGDLCSAKTIDYKNRLLNEVTNNTGGIDMLNEELLDTNISYITIGFNANFNSGFFTADTYHISLFLYSRYNSKRGIIMEFAKFTQNKDNPTIKYPYEEQGGLRYYNSTRPAYINNLCNIGNINIKLEKNYIFREILDKCCKDRTWSKDKYWLLFNNCQTFVSDALEKMNINFHLNDFYLHIPNVKPNEKIKYIPEEIIHFCVKKSY